MLRYFFLLLPLFLSTASQLWAQSDMIYMLDPNADVAFQTEAGSNPYPGLGQNAMTGEICVQPGSWYDDPYHYSNRLSNQDYDQSTLLSRGEGGELYLANIPAPQRRGMFQKLNFNAQWNPQNGGNNGLGMTHLDISATFALPLLTADSPLVITPSFQSWFFDPKNEGYATKKSLHTTGVDFRWIRPITKDRWTLDLGVSVLYSGDFHVSGNDAMRFPAHLVVIWQYNPRFKLLFGVAYLDREDDYNWLPMTGMIWTPNEDVSLELVIPRMRLLRKVHWFDGRNNQQDRQNRTDWAYVGFEFGGGSWGHEMEGLSGHLDYRDMRAFLGVERRTPSGMTLGLELGYMFDRTYEFDRAHYDVTPADTVFLRLRTSF